MPFLADVPPACPPAAAEPERQTVLVDTGPIACESLRCNSEGPGVYLVGGVVLCEKHMRDSVRSAMSATKEAHEHHPHVLYCADGFNTVERQGHQDTSALGTWERVQVCAPACLPVQAGAGRCKTIFPVHWLWTGEPMLCPQCAAAAFREVYPGR
jgi:hypothetical protein